MSEQPITAHFRYEFMYDANGRINGQRAIMNDGHNGSILNCAHPACVEMRRAADRPQENADEPPRCFKCDQPVLDEPLCGDCAQEAQDSIDALTARVAELEDRLANPKPCPVCGCRNNNREYANEYAMKWLALGQQEAAARLTALEAENKELRVRAVVAEQNNVLSRLGRSSYQEAVEAELRAKLAEEQVAHEATTHRLTALEQQIAALAQSLEREAADIPYDYPAEVVSDDCVKALRALLTRPASGEGQ